MTPRPRPYHRAEAERLLADADEWAAQVGELSPEASELTSLAWAAVHALLAIHDTLAAADRYATNEAKQREAGASCPTPLVECLRTLEATRPGTDDWPLDAAYVDGLHTAYDHLRSVLVEHGVPVSPRVDEPEMSEAAEWLSRGEPDPLDESDHRDRVLSGGGRIARQGLRHWHSPSVGGPWCEGACSGLSLADWNRHRGPLAFAPDADGAPSVTAPLPDDPADDAVDGQEGERRYLNAQTGSGDHEQQEH